MLEASCTHPPVSGLCFQEILVRKLCCAECQDCGGGRSWFLLAWKVQQGLKKKKKKSAEECASHNLQACSLWFWEHLAALGYFQSKGRHITLPPQSGEKPECFSLCNTLSFTFLFSDQNKHLAKFSSSVAGFCLLGVPKPFG